MPTKDPSRTEVFDLGEEVRCRNDHLIQYVIQCAQYIALRAGDDRPDRQCSQGAARRRHSRPTSDVPRLPPCPPPSCVVSSIGMVSLRKLLPRFSLRTLAIFTLLCTSGFGLWWHWGPWVLDKDFNTDDAKGWRRTVSPDGAKVVALSGRDDSLVVIHENRSHGRVLARFRAPNGHKMFGAIFSPDGSRIMTESVVYAPDYLTTNRLLEREVRIYRRRRPEWWWGVFYLWEFWLTAAFAGLFVWSVWRDRKALAKADV